MCLLAPVVSSAQGEHAGALKAMVLTGQNNHGWQVLSAHYETVLEATGLFEVDVVKSPPRGADMSGFAPDFASYDVVVIEYNGDDWPRRVQESFERYMENGGGMVYAHAVNHTFTNWVAFNEMMGIGGWGGRDEAAGPYVKYRDGQMVLDHRPGHAGECVDAHAFSVVTREPDHPIMRGLPPVWLHGTDELYSNQRGPAKNMTILATAYSDPAREAHWGVETHGTGEHEPMVYTIGYGQGRVFGTAMGHVDGGAEVGSGPWPAIDCEGFITLIQRGAEWAATGDVTQPVPDAFPTATDVSLR
jgi:type 1 glutamine amidotransferase